jgi:CO/xanthine dehydrogenase FAD-binding subunit
MVVMFNSYIRTSSIAETLSALQEAARPVRVLAGGTDILIQVQHSNGHDSASLIDISDVAELAGIEAGPDGLRIGAATKLADIERSDLFTGGLDVLIEGVSEVGSLQIRHLATLGGNVCNASPSADSIPALLVLNAVAELASPAGTREVPLHEFFTGPGATVLADNEILVAIRIPPVEAAARGTYIKLKEREVLDLAFVGVAVLLTQGDNGVDARIALGAVAPTPIRATQAEQLLAEADTLTEDVIRQAAQLAADACSPISDVRASAAYRQEMVKNLTEKALLQVLAEVKEL